MLASRANAELPVTVQTCMGDTPKIVLAQVSLLKLNKRNSLEMLQARADPLRALLAALLAVPAANYIAILARGLFLQGDKACCNLSGTSRFRYCNELAASNDHP